NARHARMKRENKLAKKKQYMGTSSPQVELVNIHNQRLIVDKKNNTCSNAKGEFKKRKAELSQVALSLDNEEDVEASKEGLDIPNDYTIWNEVVTKEKKKAAFGLDLSSKLDFRNFSKTSKDNLNIEQEFHMWKEKAKEQEMINEEQKIKLNDAEHKLKDQG
ncbi:hypothetical protein S245_066525, partial [Arachis hypogaea]